MNDTPTQAEAGVKRYNAGRILFPGGISQPCMDRHPEGAFVEWADYATALRERDEARRERDALQVKYDLEYRLSCARLRLWQDEDDRRVEALAALSQQTARAERALAAFEIAESNECECYPPSDTHGCKYCSAFVRIGEILRASSPPPTT